jgi:hypothetical protein
MGHEQTSIVTSASCPLSPRFYQAYAARWRIVVLAVLHKMANDCSQHLWFFPCDVLE